MRQLEGRQEAFPLVPAIAGDRHQPVPVPADRCQAHRLPADRPQFYFRTTDVTGTVTLPEGKQMVMPGDNTELTVELIHPIAMDKGLRFAIREGGRTVASGQVIEVIK